MKKIILILVSVAIMMTISGCGRDALENENKTYVDQIAILEEKIEEFQRMTMGFQNSLS